MNGNSLGQIFPVGSVLMLGMSISAGLSLASWPLATRAAECSQHPCVIAQAPAVSPEQLQANAEAFIDALFTQNYDQAWQYLGPQAQTENPPAILQMKQQAFVKRTGDFRQRVSSRVDGEIIVVKVEFSDLTDDLIVIMDPGGKIMGVDFPADPNDASAQPPSQ